MVFAGKWLGPAGVQHMMELAYDTVSLRWCQQVRGGPPPGSWNKPSSEYYWIWESDTSKFPIHEEADLPEAALTTRSAIG